jgi:hypothetical protein
MSDSTDRRRAQNRAGRGPRFVLAPVSNPPMHINEIFPACENLLHPRFRGLRRRYRLDNVVRGETDELRCILLLRHWIKRHIRINDKHPTETRGDAFGILDAALKGGGFHCAHFSLVQHAVLNAFGYVTRRLGAGPGLNKPHGGGHHGVNEVWVNSLLKWMLIDAKYDLHFEKDGVPLSALEVRAEVIKNGGSDVKRAFGPDRKYKREEFPERTHTYRWVSWETSTAHFTDWPNQGGSTLVVYGDEFFRKHTWYRDGRPHWAYKAGFFIPVKNRNWIEWTPNVVTSKVRLGRRSAAVRLVSCTPNLRTFQMRRGEGAWRNCPERVEVPLGRGGASLSFRAVNRAGVSGPVHRVEIVPA